MVRLFFLAAFVLGLSACHCYQPISCVVIDSERQVPIEGVSVRYDRNSAAIGKTDQAGSFSFAHRSGGLWCSPAKLVFEHPGYLSDTVKFDAAHDHLDTLQFIPL